MLNWGLIGAGSIAKVFCNGMRFSKTGQIVAVGSRSKERAFHSRIHLARPATYPKAERHAQAHA